MFPIVQSVTLKHITVLSYRRHCPLYSQHAKYSISGPNLLGTGVHDSCTYLPVSQSVSSSEGHSL